ncbi:hypothetical protein THAOC_01542, partial [Thalassiosira oceanica]
VGEEHRKHMWPPLLPSQYPSSGLAAPKSNAFMLPWTLPGPHRHNWLNADEQGVDARRHVVFRSGSPKNLRGRQELWWSWRSSRLLPTERKGVRPGGTPQIQQVYGAMNPLLAYTLAPMHLSAFHITRDSGKTTWEPMSTSTSTATPCFRAEILGLVFN